jgi:hypothetical protein
MKTIALNQALRISTPNPIHQKRVLAKFNLKGIVLLLFLNLVVGVEIEELVFYRANQSNQRNELKIINT